MIFDWLDEKKTPGLKKTERLMGILFDLGMAKYDQLLAITNWTPNQLKGAKNRIRAMGLNGETKAAEKLLKQLENSVISLIRNGDKITENHLMWIRNSLRAITKEDENRDDWLKIYLAYNRNDHVYSLGPQGVRYVADMMDRQSSYKELGAGQREHALGMTEILARLMRAGAKPEQWLSSREASDRIAHIQEDLTIEQDANGNWEFEKVKRGKTIRPDGAVKINGRWFYIEYDRGTKHGEKIRDQINDYIQLPGKIGQAIDPIIWVVGHQERTEELRDRIYPEVMRKYPEDYPAPEMHFFTEGEETKFLMESEPIESESETLVLPKQDEKLLERIQELEQERDQLKRQLEEQRIETSRQKGRIDYLTNLANQNRQEITELATWSKDLIQHLKESSGGFFKASPEQALTEYIEKRGYPEILKG